MVQKVGLFLLSFLSSLDASRDSEEWPGNGDGGMTSSLAKISGFMCCLYFNSLATAFPTLCFTEQAFGTGKLRQYLDIYDCMRRWTRPSVNSCDYAESYILSSSNVSAFLVQKEFAMPRSITSKIVV